MNNDDPHNLERFLSAQVEDYEVALHELRRGAKESHWIWYIFPQVAGLGSSIMADRYSIKSKDEAIAYIQHQILGTRLTACADALLHVEGKSIEDIMGFPDNLKLKSSMTLFASISPSDNVFQEVLDRYYGGAMDEKTLAFLTMSESK